MNVSDILDAKTLVKFDSMNQLEMFVKQIKKYNPDHGRAINRDIRSAFEQKKFVYGMFEADNFFCYDYNEDMDDIFTKSGFNIYDGNPNLIEIKMALNVIGD